MKKKIYLNFLCLILLSILTLSVLLGLVFYNTSVNREKDTVKDLALTVSDLLNNGLYESKTNFSYADYISGNINTARLTIIASDGGVLLDSKTDALTLENHGNRDEFIQALNTGMGEAVRYSSTFGGKTYYYAVRLKDGNVLRVSNTLGNIKSVFISVLPAIFAVTAVILVIANFSVRKLTKKILKPFDDVNFNGNNALFYDELTPFLKKIDRQKNEIAEKVVALKNRTDTIEAITGNMKEGLILLDEKGIILTANKGAGKIFGEIEMAGKSILHICREIEFQNEIHKCLSGANAKLPYNKNGKVYNVYFNPVLNEAKINGTVILFFDITDRHKAEKQRREFSANVSHELKTPLTTVSALSEMIANGMAKEDDMKEFAGKINSQTNRLINIIDDIIKLSEFDEGNILNDFTTFDIYELAYSVIASLAEKAKEKNVEINPIEGCLKITANKHMIDELLFNLIDNGIKYNKDGGKVIVDIYKADNFCKISVSDTGIGISQNHCERVFERFYRVDKSRSKKTGGTGLGLSIVKHITEYHGGKVELKSKIDVGTTVACYIKCRV